MYDGKDKDLREPLLVDGEENPGGTSISSLKEDAGKRDGSWLAKVVPTLGTTPSDKQSSPRNAKDAFWKRNTAPPAQGQQGLLSRFVDVVVGPDVEPYGFLLASLEASDERHTKQLTSVLPPPVIVEGAPSNGNSRQVAFKRLVHTAYEKSILPFAGDENPLGEVAALGVGIIVRDSMWGPDISEQPTDDQNYWQVIDAAQELALNVVFVFIRHRDSLHLDEGSVCHTKFKRLARGPWPQKQPYVFLMSYWGQFSEKQMEVIKMCLGIKDPLQVKLAINSMLRPSKTDISMWQSNPEVSIAKKKKKKQDEKKSGGSWFFNAGANNDKGKGKKKEGISGGDPEQWKAFKKRLLKKNKKQMVLLMAAQMHEMGERTKQLATVEVEVKQLREEVARLQVALKEKEGGATSKQLL